MSNFTFFHNVFYAICILQSFYSYISVVVCSFFESGMVSKWCIREWLSSSKDYKIFYSSKLMALAGNKFKVAITINFVCQMIENTVAKQKLVYIYFLLVPPFFYKYKDKTKGHYLTQLLFACFLNKSKFCC